MVETFSFLTDKDGRLSLHSGNAPTIAGRTSGAFQAKPLFELFVEDDRPAVMAALKTASRQSATVLRRQRVRTGTDSDALYDVAMEPAGAGKFWIRFTPSTGEPEVMGPATKDDFLANIADRLGLPGESAMKLLLIDIDGLRGTGLAAKLGEAGARAVRTTIEGVLSEAAIDGRIGQLDSGSYGVLGTEDQDKEDLVASVVDAAGKLGVTKEGLGATAEQVALDAQETEPEALRGLLSHVCHKFYQAARNGKAFGGERLSEISVEIEQAIRLIETALDNGDISVTARDVRTLASGEVPVYLAHGTLIFGDEEVAADRLLVMDDHPDLCARHDRAVIMTAMAALSDPAALVPVIVDIGLPTLESGEAARIGAELAASGRSVGFRPRGLDMSARRSKGVQQVYRLLKDGFPVWLVNFSTAIQKSRKLKGAYVEISATFLRDISALPDRNAMLGELLKIWNDVEVRLVAVNVDSKNLASFVSKLGIAYGIGVAADPAAEAPQSSSDATP